MLRFGLCMLNEYQRLYVAGEGDTIDRNICWYITSDGIERIALEITSNAEEADTRVWKHVKMCNGSKVLFCHLMQMYTTSDYYKKTVTRTYLYS